MDLNFPCFTWRDLEEIPLTVVEHTVVHIGSKGKEENTCMLTIVLFFSGCLEALPPKRELNYIQNLYNIMKFLIFTGCNTCSSSTRSVERL